MASKWRHGCGTKMSVTVPRGYGYKTVTVECGSTAIDGGINQCHECEQQFAAPPALEDEGDLEYDDRVFGHD